ncbi:TonB-dependent receptor [Acidovorax cavernicola]|uniref:TonB-dependent receptor n=1 Tax=Acidovorax cavernicola TaxID=1675792 RepID=A0A9X8D2N2_9BURK|nr:TonB-dependent receptor [Acidovorax cavernicola]RIX77230.1 TonB-dependent receptor [Acidovorax cavernicola]
MLIHPPSSRFQFKAPCLRLAVAIACGGMHLLAGAQSSAPSSAAPPIEPASAPKTIESVSVTAQRRREPAREVPLTADVLKGEDMERGGYQSLSDLAALLPGMNHNQSGGGTGGSQITMRGISTGSQVGATVGMYVDDVPFGSSSAYAGGGSSSLDLGLFDLASVESLRGPQGTLYGAGAMGGLIKYVAVEPDPSYFSAQATAETSSTKGGKSGHVLRGMLNVPLSEGVAALRATLYQRSESGFVRDVNHGGRLVDGSKTDGARVALLLTPSKDVTLRLTALSQKQRRDGASTEDVDIATGRPVDGALTKRLLLSEPSEVRNDLVSAALKVDLKWATLDSITGWQRTSSLGRVDSSALYSPLLAPTGIVNAAYGMDYTFNNRKVTQEVRLTSPRSRQFEWLAGMFYTNESGSKTQNLRPFNAFQQPESPVLADARFPSTFRETAIFGTGTYYLTPEADITLGVRRSRNSQHLDQRFSGIFAPAPQPASQSSEGVTTWLLTGRWRPAERQAVYVRAASGYRPGGPLPLVINPLDGTALNNSSFKSDSLWSYEVGWKGDIVPGRLTTEVALYQIDWKDMQVFTSSAGFSGIGNAGRARSRGIEWTVRAAPTDSLRLATALSAIDAKLVDDSRDLGGKAGERLPNTARLSLALQADYDFRLGGNPAYLGATLRYTGDRWNSFKEAPGIPAYRMPAYTAIDLRGGVQIGKANIGLFVRNLTNRRGQTAADTTLSTAGGPARVNLIAPRTIGLQFSMDFS